MLKKIMRIYLYTLFFCLISNVLYAQNLFKGVLIGIEKQPSGLNHIVKIDSTGVVTYLTQTENEYREPRFAPNGITFVYSIIRDTVLSKDEALIQPFNSLPNFNKIFDTSEYPYPIADGDSISFFLNELWLMDIDGNHNRKISDNSALMTHGNYSWHPLGKKIIYVSYKPFGISKGLLREIDIDNGDDSSIVVKLGEYGLKGYDFGYGQYSPDGKYILFSNGYYGDNIGRIFIKDVETEEIFLFYEVNRLPGILLWSPSANRIMEYSTLTDGDVFNIYWTDKMHEFSGKILDYRYFTTLGRKSINFYTAIWSHDGEKVLVNMLTKEGDFEYFILDNDFRDGKQINLNKQLEYLSWGGYARPEYNEDYRISGELIRYYNPTIYAIFVLISISLCFWLTSILAYKYTNKGSFLLTPISFLTFYFLFFKLEPGIILNSGYSTILIIMTFAGLKFGKYHAKEVHFARKELLVKLLDFGHSGIVTKNINQMIFSSEKLVKDSLDKFALKKMIGSSDEFLTHSSKEIQNLIYSASKTHYQMQIKRIKKRFAEVNMFLPEKIFIEGMYYEFSTKLSALQFAIDELESTNDYYFKTNVVETINEIVVFFENNSDNKVKVDLEKQGVNTLYAKIESSELIFIITNLMQNAIRSMKNINDKKIKIELTTDSTRFYIRIKDLGCGITKDKWETIFMPCYSENNGSGVGLYRSRVLLSAYKGKLEIESSRRHVGTTFILTLRLLAI